jgi:hypothetical protein
MTLQERTAWVHHQAYLLAKLATTENPDLVKLKDALVMVMNEAGGALLEVREQLAGQQQAPTISSAA